MFIKTQLFNSDIIFQVSSMEKISNQIVFRGEGNRYSAFIECKDEKEAEFYFQNLSENVRLDQGIFSKIGDYEILANWNSEGARDFRPARKVPN